MHATAPRLISADDHADIGHDQVKRHLSPRLHDDYDAGVAAFRAAASGAQSVEANRRWRDQQGLATDGPLPTMADRRRHAAAGRPGHTDPVERLKDMEQMTANNPVSQNEMSQGDIELF